MKKKLTMLTALVMAVSMICVPSVTASTASAERGKYVNGVYKFNDKVTIKALARYNSTHVSDPKDLWLYEWASNEMNIEFDVEGVDTAAVNERTSLIFASGNMPDVILNWPTLRPLAKHAQYGDGEGQLLAISDYVSPDITPNLCKAIEEVPHVWESVKTLTGNAYVFPIFYEKAENRTNRYYGPLWYNVPAFTEAGYPNGCATETEFLDALRKIKSADPLGAGDNLVPYGGMASGSNSVQLAILNAFGFYTSYPDDNLITRGGAEGVGNLVYMPADPVYYEYLKYMNTLYKEGLIDHDLYTIDDVQTYAKRDAGYYAVYSTNLSPAAPLDWQEWSMFEPLTSEFNDEKITVCAGDGRMTEVTFITSACKDPEAVMRFMDVGYGEKGYLFYYGPQLGVDETYHSDIDGWYLDESYTRVYGEKSSSKYPNSVSQIINNMTPYGQLTGPLFGRTDGSLINKDITTKGGYDNVEFLSKGSPYYQKQFLGSQFETETTARLADVKAVMDEYTKSESAKFITGARPLTQSEWDGYIQTLNSMDLQEFMDIQTKAYEEQFLNK